MLTFGYLRNVSLSKYVRSSEGILELNNRLRKEKIPARSDNVNPVLPPKQQSKRRVRNISLFRIPPFSKWIAEKNNITISATHNTKNDIHIIAHSNRLSFRNRPKP